MAEPVKRTPVDLSHLRHRQLIGCLGLALPFLVWAFSRIWPPHDGPWRMLGSISAFYYTSANGVFVGSLFALAMFLFSYAGYEGDLADRVLGKIACFAAIGVAMLPTHAPPPFPEPLWWSGWMGKAHYAAAALLFSSFIAFAIWIFRRSSAPSKSEMSPGKRKRNRVFLVCGLVMIASVLWIAIAAYTEHSIFLPEAIALVAFAISWLVKGRAHEPVARTLLRLRGRQG